MTKTILVTGATDGIGLLTAKQLAAKGHTLLLHGRDESKLFTASTEVGGNNASFLADLSNLSEVERLAKAIAQDYTKVDVLINNAGVLKAANAQTGSGLDIRFVVNTFAPYILTQKLLPIIPKTGRIINLSSAAQAPIDPEAMSGRKALADMDAYAQSKLAITIWSQQLAATLPDGPVVVAVNPGSLLASKMVKEGFGVEGNDLAIGSDILCRAALDDEFRFASGKYYDNDARQFADPQAAARDDEHVAMVMTTLKQVIQSNSL